MYLNLFRDYSFRARRAVLGGNRTRRTRVYGIGTGKSGTHSIAHMFSKNVRAEHEPQFAEVIDHVIDWREGRISDAQMVDWIRRRDREMALEVDSAGLNNELLDILLREFPDARFVLTIRDCYSWLNSNINHRMRFNGRPHPSWDKLRQWRADAQVLTYAPEEQVLKDNKLRPLDSLLGGWASRNRSVLEKVPPSKLLVVRTDQITQKAFEIADFAGLPRRTVRVEQSHAFRNPAARQPIQEIDRSFLEQKVEQHCLPLMTRFFPDIKSLGDARLSVVEQKEQVKTGKALLQSAAVLLLGSCPYFYDLLDVLDALDDFAI